MDFKMTNKTCRVEVQQDHLNKLSNSAPEKALAELIWNALDADATTVDILLKNNDFGIQEITVRDNGNGFSLNEAESLFSSLGGSWKAKKFKSKKGRYLHGKHGQGRFKAFALGRHVEWRIHQHETFSLTTSVDDLEHFLITETETDVATPFTTTVIITELNKDFQILNTKTATEKLLPIFSLYLMNYKNVSISIDGIKLSPDELINRRSVCPLEQINYKEFSHSIELEIIEWNNANENELWYCSAEGFPIEKYHRKINITGKFTFSAYLKSTFLSVLEKEGTIGLGELNKELQSVINETVRKIKTYFNNRSLEEGQSQIQKWKSEEVYPFKVDAKSPTEVAERQIFDIVAVKLAENLPTLDNTDKKTKSFQLRMLKHAVETSPEELKNVITEVLNLPKKKLEELSSLLEDASLSNIISASKLVSDRLKFISGLECLLFDKHSKNHLRERSQLHRILAENSWVFGQEFSVTVDDQSLTEVLRKHQKINGINSPINEPVTRIDGSTGIVDLMLSRSVPRNREDEVEYLIVELKAPKVKVGQAECSQIESYAFAVSADERFASLSATWNFWVISNEMTPDAKKKSNQNDRPRGIIHQSNDGVKITVWAKEWSQIIQENKYRLRFIQEKLNSSIDRQSGIKHLREIYSEFTKGVIIEDEPETPDTPI